MYQNYIELSLLYGISLNSALLFTVGWWNHSMYITPIWMLIGDDDDMVIFRLQELPGQHLCHRTRDHKGPMTASDRFDGSWSDFWKFLAPWHDMMYGSQGVKCKGHDEISWNCNLCHCLQLNEALRPGFGQWDSNLSNVWSERSMVSPTLGARHVFSIRIYMLYVYTQYIMWLEGVLNLCVYHSSLTRWQELMCWSNLNMVQCINAWRCFFATSNSWKCQAIWGRSSELSASQRIQRISIVRTFNMCSLHDQWRGQLQRREWQTLTRWRVLHLYCRLVSHADLVEWVWTV